MTLYLMAHLHLSMDQANHIRDLYWKKYGATLLGVMQNHNTDPHHFLNATHQFDNVATVTHRPASIPHRLSKLSGTRVLLTNAPRLYALSVLRALNLDKHLHAVISIEDMVIHQRWRPKPSAWLWMRLKRLISARPLVLVDDTRGHLHQAARQGIETVWITFPELHFAPLARKGRQVHRIKHFDQIRLLPLRKQGRPGLS